MVAGVQIVRALVLICSAFFFFNALFLYRGGGKRPRFEPYEDSLEPFSTRNANRPQRLAVVSAFAASQLNKAAESIRLWDSKVPCLKEGVRDRAVLIVYADVDWGGVGGPLKEQVEESEVIRACFWQVAFVSANLSAADNVYDKVGGWKKSHFWVRGPNMAFYNMLFSELPKLAPLNIGHLFWMEPDVTPIRQGWLDRLLYEAHKGPYWIQGSSFRGKCLPQTDGSCVGIGRDIVGHVNGNGLWNVGDPAMVVFIFEVANGKYTHWPFDLAPLMHMQRVWTESQYRNYMHLYQHVDWVRNYGSYPFEWGDIPPHVALVHYSPPALEKDVPDDQVSVPEQDRWIDDLIRKEGEASKRVAELEGQLAQLQLASAGGGDEGDAPLNEAPPADPHLTQALSKAANKRRQVALTLASANWTAVLGNFVYHARKANFAKHVVVIALDKETSKYCKNHLGKIGGVVDLWKEKKAGGEFGWGGFDPSKPDVGVRNARFSVLLRCLRQGYHVLMSDADVIWLKSPFSYFNNELDLQVQSDSHTEYRQEYEGGKSIDTAVSGGLHYSVARPRVIRFYQALVDSMQNHPEDTPEEELLQDLLAKNTFRLRWRVLEPALFPNGVLYFEQGLSQSLGVPPLALHNNWVDGPRTAVYRFREANLWAMDPPGGHNVTRGGKKFMTYFDQVEDNGLNNQRQNLRTALAVAQLLNRTLILPVFHREHRKSSPVTLDYYFDYDAFSDNFPEALPHSFLEKAFPHWETLPVQYINNGLPDPTSAPWWPRAQLFHTKYFHLGSSEDELLEWFGTNQEPLLVFQSMLRRFGPFKDPTVQDTFNRRIFKGVAPNQVVADIKDHLAGSVRKAANSEDFNCLHLRRGDTFLKDHADFEKSIPEIAQLLTKYVPSSEPLYVCTDAATEETRKHFTDAGFSHVYFISDFYPPWMRSYVELLNGKLNMRYGQIDQLACSVAKTFVGNVYSTFTFHIGYLRQMYGFAQVCQDIYDRKLDDAQIFV